MALLLLSYLLGSIPFGKLVGKLHKVDIQKKGSGNIGFANAFRVLGWKPALLVLAGDVLKGYAAVWVARRYYYPGFEVMAVGLTVVLGHIFPVWLKFKGGKGIATGLGVTAALHPVFAIVGLAFYGLGLLLFRRSGPASILGASSLPVFCLFYDPMNVVFFLLLALLAIWTHRSNLEELAKMP